MLIAFLLSSFCEFSFFLLYSELWFAYVEVVWEHASYIFSNLCPFADKKRRILCRNVADNDPSFELLPNLFVHRVSIVGLCGGVLEAYRA